MTPIKILGIRLRDIGCIQLLDLEIKDSVVVVSGPNGAGKSTVLESFLLAFGTPSQLPEAIVRKGAKNGEVVHTYNEFELRKVFGPDDSLLEIEITPRDGNVKRGRGAESFLRGLWDDALADPMKLARLDGKALADYMLARFPPPVDIKALDRQRTSVYDDRTEANREIKSVEARLERLSHLPSEKPDAPDAKALLAQQAELIAQNERLAQLGTELRNAAQSAVDAAKDVENSYAEIKELEESLEEAKADSNHFKQRFEAAETAKRKAAVALKEAADPTEKLAEINAKLATVTEAAAAASQWESREAERAALATQRKRSQSLTEKLESIDKAKREALHKAKFPEGLGIDETGSLTLNELPFSKASQAEKVVACAEVEMSRPAQIRVMPLSDAQFLDQKNLARLYAKAKAAGFVIMAEVVEETGGAIHVESYSPAGAVSITPSGEEAPAPLCAAPAMPLDDDD